MLQKRFRWFLTVGLIGGFVAGPAPFAQGEIGPAPAANRADRQRDRRKLEPQVRRIERHHQRLGADIRQFGRNSTRARIDRCQPTHAGRRYDRQARDLSRDRQQALRRHAG